MRKSKHVIYKTLLLKQIYNTLYTKIKCTRKIVYYSLVI